MKINSRLQPRATGWVKVESYLSLEVAECAWTSLVRLSGHVYTWLLTHLIRKTYDGEVSIIEKSVTHYPRATPERIACEVCKPEETQVPELRSSVTTSFRFCAGSASRFQKARLWRFLARTVREKPQHSKPSRDCSNPRTAACAMAVFCLKTTAWISWAQKELCAKASCKCPRVGACSSI
jgi:hypothetical protein